MQAEDHRRTAPVVLAWGLCGLFVLLWLAGVLLYIAGGARGVPVLGTLVCGYTLVGALVAIREPHNAVGWLMLTIASLVAAKDLTDVYVNNLDSPLVTPVAWAANLLPTSGIYVAVLALLLLFPDGQLSTRLQPVVWFGLAGLALPLVGAAFGAALPEVATPVTVANPLAAIGSARAEVSAVTVMGELLLTTGLVLGTFSLVVRLHRSRGRRRQQVKWFAYVGALALGGLLLARFAAATQEAGWVPVVGNVGWYSALFFLTIGIPVAIGIAILRHRLYDIDLVIQRTLVYGSLTLTLAGVYLLVYFVSVEALQRLLDLVTDDNDLAVAASTLAVAALFPPARGRIQRVVDRHFYRRKYDATRTVEAFTGRLRQEVDLDAVSADLLEVVHDTVQPSHVTLWLRGTS